MPDGDCFRRMGTAASAGLRAVESLTFKKCVFRGVPMAGLEPARAFKPNGF